MLHVDDHPLLDLRVILARFARPLGDLSAPDALHSALRSDAATPLTAPDADVRARVRDLLRRGGYKPTGRGKPAAEYLAKAADDGRLGAINPAVDVGNAVSLHSGLPISAVDHDRLRPPLRVGLAAADATYVFNPAGQTLRASGLLSLHDDAGPCANAVKDAQRTKTDPTTRAVLYLLWGARGLETRVDAAAAWCRTLLADLGAEIAADLRYTPGHHEPT
ncbi:MAG: phenylalanine--tRNA ligase beta subunit-related protein [Acidobacteriota bacterium]